MTLSASCRASSRTRVSLRRSSGNRRRIRSNSVPSTPTAARVGPAPGASTATSNTGPLAGRRGPACTRAPANTIPASCPMGLPPLGAQSCHASRRSTGASPVVGTTHTPSSPTRRSQCAQHSDSPSSATSSMSCRVRSRLTCPGDTAASPRADRTRPTPGGCGVTRRPKRRANASVTHETSHPVSHLSRPTSAPARKGTLESVHPEPPAAARAATTASQRPASPTRIRQTSLGERKAAPASPPTRSPAPTRPPPRGPS